MVFYFIIVMFGIEWSLATTVHRFVQIEVGDKIDVFGDSQEMHHFRQVHVSGGWLKFQAAAWSFLYSSVLW